jgi:predicted transcriptional regulator
MNKRLKNFRVPSEPMEDKDLSAGTKLVLVALCSYANKDGIAWPSLTTLATYTNYNEKTIRRKISDLIEKDYIKKKKGGGKGHPNKYIIARLGVRDSWTF